VVARLIHNNGARASGAFVAVNCGAIPPELMESELFGHTKGSFTGANQDKIGLFQAAAGGTLFLDEVADLPLGMQVKLLRAIQEKAIRPVGANEEQATDVRLLSATHKDLANEVQAGRFRNDLYYRINVIDLYVPSLRERIEDVPELAEVLLARIARDEGEEKPRLEKSAIDALCNYSFPGNVRELENMLERALALSEGANITADDLQFSGNAAPTSPPAHNTDKTVATAAVAGGGPQELDLEAAYGDLEGYLESIEKQIISKALEESRWNRTATAKLLGISFRSLRYRLKKLGLED
jgi:two-component system response regulator PilR (NtrC family)